MKAVKHIKISDVLTIDIETVRLEENFLDLPEEHREAWRDKFKKDGVAPTLEKASEIWNQAASLYAEHSKVCAISLAFLHSTEGLRIKTYYGEDEGQILEDFKRDLTALEVLNPSNRILGHSSKFFDIPFLCKRFIINNKEIPLILDESDLKPWEKKNIDTNELWKSFGTGYGSSLRALCNILNIPSSKTDLLGDEVGDSYFKKEFKRIADYCSLDTLSTFNVFLSFKKDPFISKEDVTFVFQEGVSNGEVEKEEFTLFEHLMAEGSLSSKTIDKIVEEVHAKKLDKRVVLLLVKAALSRRKPDNKILREDFYPLKEAFNLPHDTSLIKDLEVKGNLTKALAESYIKTYKDATEEVKKGVIELVEEFLIEKEKVSQVGAKKNLDLITLKLK